MISQEDKLATDSSGTLERRRAFMKLSLDERRKILAEQAERMLRHYEFEAARTERAEWQGGDIVEL